MARNQVQFQKGLSLTQFLDAYGTEAQCHQALYQWKWPDGFQCPHCGHSKYSKVSTRKLYQCSRCHHQTSVTSGSIFAATKLLLTTWFLGIYLVTQSKNGISALELMRQLGITYNAAWRMKHKLMQVMKERDDSRPLEGIIQLDDAYWGGEHRGGKRGRGAAGKSPFVAAVATNQQGHPMAMKLTKVKGFRSEEIARWSEKHLARDSYVVSDGLPCFRAVQDSGCEHEAIVTGGGPSSVELEAFTWIINPATKYTVFRASSRPLIQAWLAGNGCSIGKSHNAEQVPA